MPNRFRYLKLNTQMIKGYLLNGIKYQQQQKSAGLIWTNGLSVSILILINSNKRNKITIQQPLKVAPLATNLIEMNCSRCNRPWTYTLSN